jgi:hypothetical protein
MHGEVISARVARNDFATEILIGVARSAWRTVMGE